MSVLSTVLFCYYTDIIFSATWSLVAGSENSLFPLANLNDVYPDHVSKLTGVSGTYRGTISSYAIQGVAFINTNLAGQTIAVTNNGGMPSQNLIIPAYSVDSLSLNGFKDLRAVTTAATQWNFATPGGGPNVAVGNILLIKTLRQMKISWKPTIPETKPAIIKRTSVGQAVGYPKGTRNRGIEFDLYLESERAAYTELRRSSVGPSQPFLFILEDTVNDCMYSFFPNVTWRHSRQSPGMTGINDVLEEMNPGAGL